MALPYLQISSKFIRTDAQYIAALLRVPRQQVVGMAADLFDFTVERTSGEDRPPDGVFLDPDAPDILEAAAGWTGEPGKMVEAFIRGGVIEKLEIGVRVKGCDRYKTTWEKNNRRKQRTGDKPDGNRTVTGADAPGNRPQDGDGDGDEEDPSVVVVQPPAKPKKPKASTPQAQFAEWAEGNRLGRVGLDGAADKPKPQAFVRIAAAITQYGRPRLERAHAAYLGDKFASTTDPPFCLALFASQADKWVSVGDRAGPPRDEGPTCSVPGCSTPAPGQVWGKHYCYGEHMSAAMAAIEQREAG